MKEIRIKVTEEELKNLQSHAELMDTKPKRILEQFIADLTCSEQSGGSDERDLASSWFYRSEYNF